MMVRDSDPVQGGKYSGSAAVSAACGGWTEIRFFSSDGEPSAWVGLAKWITQRILNARTRFVISPLSEPAHTRASIAECLARIDGAHVSDTVGMRERSFLRRSS
mmetsp:Transcript_62163/g.166428  ORF Transcript_62163/g.166428 Transcript_62163/m.166428 type:complete len:104 (-) Transcript_62163:9-320(-)